MKQSEMAATFAGLGNSKPSYESVLVAASAGSSVTYQKGAGGSLRPAVAC